MNERPVPTALNVVAILFLLSGIDSIFNIIAHLTRASIHLDFGVLGIPIFFGLRSFSPGWRTCALVFIWLGLLLAPVAAIFGLTTSGTVTFNAFGVHKAEVSPLWLTVAGVAIFLFVLWQYRVLTRPDIRTLFYPTGNV